MVRKLTALFAFSAVLVVSVFAANAALVQADGIGIERVSYHLPGLPQSPIAQEADALPPGQPQLPVRAAEKPGRQAATPDFRIVDTRANTGFRYGQLNSPFEYEKIRYFYHESRKLKIAD